jgi:hypothetical protein
MQELLSLSLSRLSDIWATVRGQIDDRILSETSAELEQDADAIESILICVSHQGRIADDVGISAPIGVWTILTRCV